MYFFSCFRTVFLRKKNIKIFVSFSTLSPLLLFFFFLFKIKNKHEYFFEQIYQNNETSSLCAECMNVLIFLRMDTFFFFFFF